MRRMPQVLPLPKNADWRDGRVAMPEAVSLVGPAPERVLAALGLPQVEGAQFLVRWAVAPGQPEFGDDEGYVLSIEPGAIVLEAPTLWGVLRGIATIEMLNEDGWLPVCRIEDSPRFPWRGLMLDPARRFLSMNTLRAVLDGMARLKLNVLHLHLTDDQGFRFPSQAFPKLASKEHYTPAELRKLVAYAAQRGIRVVPELDMPGHVTSWVVAYPDWGIEAAEPSRRFGVHAAALDMSSPVVLEAVGTLLEEVVEIFPDRYLHVGGDEVSGDASALQNAFLVAVVAKVRALGRIPIGWDEVLHEDMPEGLVVQSWRGATSRDKVLKAGCDCVVSSGYYLDLMYPADVHYAYDPEASESELLRQEDALLADPRFAHVAEGMRWTHSWRQDVALPMGRPAGRVLGGEACLWGELVDDEALPNRLWSRLPAVAERLWSQVEVVDAESLLSRWPHWCRQRVEHPLLALCEPVKWYGRLLGEVALQARIHGVEMPQARPYDADTPLNRPIDCLPPESMAARGVLADSDDELAARCQTWLQVSDPLEAELSELCSAIRSAAQLTLSFLDGQSAKEDVLNQLWALHKPYGEYMPAVIPFLAERLE